jgi:hypothetical protein
VTAPDRSAPAENVAHRYRIESSPERKLPRYWKTAKISRLNVKVPACDQGSMGRPGGNREPAVNWKIEYSSLESDRPR